MKILIVAGCQAGVAHSKMVTASLQEEIESRGHEVACEEYGGWAVPKKADPKFVETADLVILATAIRIMGMERFKHLPIYKEEVHKALMDPKGTVDRALEMLKNADKK
ncbi:MAG TPA: PTS fructose transporter subunit IIB [Anaerolineae bacterium]|nr:PTS fructose transporter subunit IIB [Anaerolineae bacterium]